MEYFRIHIEEAPLSWNTLARKHYWTFKEAFERWKWLTVEAARKQPVKPVGEAKVRMVFTASWKGKRRHDIDNIVVKPILDQLRDMGIFPDDDAKHVVEVVLRGATGCAQDGLEIVCESV